MTAARVAATAGSDNGGVNLAPDDVSIAERFRWQAARTPSAPAIVTSNGMLTYEDVRDASDVLAAALSARLGRGPHRVAVTTPRGWTYVPAMLGVLTAGYVHVPIDPGYPEARRELLLSDSGAAIAITAPPTAAPSLAELTVVDLMTAAPAASHERESGAGARDGDAYVMYTSGTTGRPKGVRVTHRNLMHSLTALQARFQFAPDDVFASLAPFAFDISLFELCTPWLTGGSTRIFTRDEVLDIPRLIDALSAITVLHAVPSLMREIVDEIERRQSPAHVRHVFVGGERVPPDLVNRMRAAFPAAAIHVLYGPTEATIVCSSHEVIADLPPAWHPIGIPLGNVTAWVLDEERRPVPAGTPGELYVGGPGVTPGYVGADVLTAERFVAVSGQRCYRTGDRVLRDDTGTLLFLGRSDGQVKIRGHRVEMVEIERAILDSPVIHQAIVRAADDVEGATRLVAYVVPREVAREPVTPSLRVHLVASLPAFMVPHEIVELTHLPLLPNGKIDHEALQRLSAERDARPDSPAIGGDALSPVEYVVSAVWRELLQCGPIAGADDFFGLGGHSLSATRAVRWLGDVFDAELPVRLLFEASRLREFAAAVTRVCGPDRVASAIKSLEQYR
jgi:amino acid adenylation domain-containing protein